MADDVLRNAAPQQPAPNITNNIIKTTSEQDKNMDDNMMDEDIVDIKKLVNKNSYVQPSTKSIVANQTTAAATITNKVETNDCPATPYTSNTTNARFNSSQSYLLKTPTTPTNNDMSIDNQSPTQQFPLRSSTRTPSTRAFKEKSTKPPPLLSSPTNTSAYQKSKSVLNRQPTTSPKVPPIKPFFLGENTINMTSLAAAVATTQYETSNNDQETVHANEKSDNRSESSMDTSDVSKPILKPKSIFNPYSKQQRQLEKSKNDTTPAANKEIINSASINSTVQQLAVETNILIPLAIPPSTNDSQDNTSKSTEPTINELTKEETEILSMEITRHEQEQQWQEVKVKTPNKKEQPMKHQPKPIDTNPYSALQDEDTDNETSVSNTSTKNHNDSTNEVDIPNNIINENTSARGKQHTPRQNRTKNPGRGGGIRVNNNSPQKIPGTTPKSNAKEKHNSYVHEKMSDGVPDHCNENMEIDDPPPISKSASTQENITTPSDGTKQNITPDNSNKLQNNNPSPKPQPR
jgi:hypothetical protein